MKKNPPLPGLQRPHSFVQSNHRVASSGVFTIIIPMIAAMIPMRGRSGEHHHADRCRMNPIPAFSADTASVAPRSSLRYFAAVDSNRSAPRPAQSPTLSRLSRDHCGISRVVLRNTGLDLTDEIGANIGALCKYRRRVARTTPQTRAKP